MMTVTIVVTASFLHVVIVVTITVIMFGRVLRTRIVAMFLTRRMFMVMPFAGDNRHAGYAEPVTVHDLAAPPCGDRQRQRSGGKQGDKNCRRGLRPRCPTPERQQ